METEDSEEEKKSNEANLQTIENLGSRDNEKKMIIDDEPFDDLMSLEKLTRSPEEKIPGVKEFVSMNTPPITTSPPAWTRGLTDEDINTMHQLGALSTTGLIAEIKKLYDQAYQLGVQEAKEMTRGKYLNIFTSSKKK